MSARAGSVAPFTRSEDEYLRFGLFYPSTSLTSIMIPRLEAENPPLLDFRSHVEVGRAAEEAGFDYLFMADRWETNGPLSRERHINNPYLYGLVLAAMLAAATERIGVANTVHLMYTPAQVVARYGANVDALSGGRWGVNIVSGSGFGEGLLPEPARSLGHDARYEYAAEVMEVVKGLWTGRPVSFKGKYIDLDGQLIEPLPLQQPFPGIISAGASGPGLDLAAQHADYLFFPGAAGTDKALEFRAQINGMLAKHGRRPSSLKLQTSMFPIISDSQDEAESLAAGWAAEVDVDTAREMISSLSSASETYKNLWAGASDERVKSVGFGAAKHRIAGTPRYVAEQLLKMYSEMGVRGVVVDFPIWQPAVIRSFGTEVLPHLREAGIWLPPQERGYSW